jgi:hypothetical protein
MWLMFGVSLPAERMTPVLETGILMVTYSQSRMMEAGMALDRLKSREFKGQEAMIHKEDSLIYYT